MKIGVISDTHGHLDPQIPGLFDGVEHILHAGDVGPHSLLIELEHIAPVTVVLGNTDFGLHIRETEIVELGGHTFLINHIVDPGRLDPMLKRRIQKRKPDVVVYGHTHSANDEKIGGIRFFNPGYAGARRMSQPRSAALFHCRNGQLRAEFVDLG